MHKPIYFRDWWSRYGFWVAILFVVECFWLGAYGATWTAFLMPVSLVWSIATAVRLVTDRVAALRFWRPYVVKWLSWWALNALASSLMLGIIMAQFAYLFHIDKYGQLAILLIFPMWRLFKHVAADLQELKKAQLARYWQHYFKAAV